MTGWLGLEYNKPNMPPQAPKLDWQEAKRFVDGDVAVAVEMVEGYRPRYSLRMGRVRPDGSITSFVSVQIEGALSPKLVPFAERQAKLLAQAEEWISTDVGYRAESTIDKRIERETKQANYGKQETRVTGKTAKKKARLAARTQTPAA